MYEYSKVNFVLHYGTKFSFNTDKNIDNNLCSVFIVLCDKRRGFALLSPKFRIAFFANHVTYLKFCNAHYPNRLFLGRSVA